MKTLAFQLANWGAALGMLAGLFEVTIGLFIRAWIGYKENPFVLGLVTLCLSGLAWLTVRMAQRHPPQTSDGKLALILGVVLPASVCFTTVGMLWYLPGILLSVAASLLIADIWRNRSHNAIQLWRWPGSLGALACLLSFGIAFWNPAFGLFRLIVPVRSDRLILEVLPMDVVRRTVYAFGVTRVETLESGAVMAVYLLIGLGAGVSLLASLASSRLFARIGGGMSLAGMVLFLWQLPAILLQANVQSGFSLWPAFGWGWYLSMLGTALILLGAFMRQPTTGTFFNSNRLFKRNIL